MDNTADFEITIRGANETLREVLDMLSEALNEGGVLVPSETFPVDPDEQPRWIDFYRSVEWEGNTTATISGEGNCSTLVKMVRELSLQYPDVIFEVGYFVEGCYSGAFEFSNGVFREIDYRTECTCHMCDCEWLGATDGY